MSLIVELLIVAIFVSIVGFFVEKAFGSMIRKHFEDINAKKNSNKVDALVEKTFRNRNNGDK